MLKTEVFVWVTVNCDRICLYYKWESRKLWQSLWRSLLFSFNVFNCYLAATRPTLGHCWGGSLTNKMLITACWLSHNNSRDHIIYGWAIRTQFFLISANHNPVLTSSVLPGGVMRTTDRWPTNHLSTNSKHVLHFIILENFNNHFFFFY